MEPRESVANESPNRIRDHFARTSRFNPTKSLTSLTSQLAQEYEDRFLIELVQNAYDAHTPGTRTGRVHVLLDECSTKHAILYVANTGNSFTANNFDALTNVAQSSKPPGEGIGNKGVGFRSVLQVCEYPEIYSCHPERSGGDGFDGFCFRFATDDDLRVMVADERQFETVSTDFSRYLLPVGARADDPRLKDLRDSGMVTVVRLPLTTARAVKLARTQVQRLLTPSPPIALFLDRLVEITVEHDDEGGERHEAVIDRIVEVTQSPSASLQLEWVRTLGERFLLATRVIPAGELRRVAGEAVENGDLDRSWLAWDTDAHVSVAIQADAASHDRAEWPSSYTHLPMRVPSPLFAHLHAPFHTKMARLDLQERSTFNAFLMSEVGDLVAETLASFVTEGGTGLGLRTRQAAVIDLLSWDTNHIDILVAALNRRGLSLDAWPVVPVMSAAGPAWAPLRDVRVWEEGTLHVMTSERLQSHVALLEPTLGGARRHRFAQVCNKALAADLAPADNEIADWIEAVALELGSGSIVLWNRFPSDVAALFSTRRIQTLQRRRFLLDNQRKLRRSGPWEPGDAKSDPTVFLPPQIATAAAGDEEDGTGDDYLGAVPKNLQRAITFLHDGIRLRRREAGAFRRTPVGDLLNSGDLVERFELNAVLGHLERLLASSASSTTYRQALSWVFAQEQASRANIADLSRMRLHVPTANGWIPATDAVFSPGWDTPLARDLDRLVETAAGTSPSLTQLGAQRIVSPAEWPFKPRNIDAFRSFLSRAGVRDGLHPTPLHARGPVRANGIDFSPEWITARFGLIRSQIWITHVKEAWRKSSFPSPTLLVGPYTPYTGDATLWTVPGRDAFEDLPSQAKDYLAICLLANIHNWEPKTWRYQFRRRSPHHASKQDPQTWPSPAATFVEREPWFPMADANHRDEHYFVPVERGWTFDESTNETAPRFARLSPVQHRRRLADSPGAHKLLTNAGLQTWNSPDSAHRRLREFGELVDSGELADADALSVQRGIAKAWSDFVHHRTTALDDHLHLVVTRKFVLTAMTPTPEEPSDVYVHDVPPGLAAHVLETSGFPVLVADPSDGTQVADQISRIAGFRPRPTSTVTANVVVDRCQVVPGADAGVALLDSFEPWLVRTVLAVVDIRSTRFMRVTEKVLHDAEARLRRTRLVTGTAIEIDIDDQTIPAVGRLAECVHIRDQKAPLLALNTTNLDLPSWHALAVIADDLAEVIGQGQVASEIRATAFALDRVIDDWREPTDAELALALRCTPDTVAEVMRHLRTSTDHLRLLLMPFVASTAGLDAGRAFGDMSFTDPEALRNELCHLVGIDEAARLLEGADRAESIDSLRREVATNLATLNDALIGLGHRPLTFPEAHDVAVQNYVRENRHVLLDSLRRRFYAAFQTRGDLRAYADARDLRSVKPDPAWLLTHEVPTDEMLGEALTGWLEHQGNAGDLEAEFDPIDEVRAANAEILINDLPHIAAIVEAWTAKRNQEPPTAWRQVTAVRDGLNTSGCLDFVVLKRPDLTSWLSALGLWPDEMPLTLELEPLGLTPAEVAKGKASRTSFRERSRRRRTELTFGDRTFDTAGDDLALFLEAVESSVDEEFLSTRPTGAKLEVLAAPKRRRGAPGGVSGGRPTDGSWKPSAEQTAAIGLAGEVLAYRWLQHNYAETTPESWVSGNRTHQLVGHSGDDTLGYDFVIYRKHETLYFEVKATTTEEFAFDIGESELRAARARKGAYRVLFIRSILSPSDRELLVLPNPLEPASRSLFVQVNQGMRLRFEVPARP